ncbi:MAG: tetratricopeptide repeat protein [Lentisphaerae bacterium]|nr:tetratricopeptide repeat protein [Lentisphaerota bacterium]
MTLFRTPFILLALVAACLLAPAVAPAADLRAEEDRRAFADGLFSREMYRAAAIEYAELLLLHPQGEDRDMLYFRLGESLRLSGDRENAAKAFLKASQVPEGPFRLRARFKRAALFLEIGQAEAAAEMFDALLKETLPDDIRELSLYYHGESLSQSGHDAQAAQQLEALLKAYPRSEMAAYAKLSLGRIYAQPGEAADVARSRKLLDEVAEAPPTPRLGAEALYLIARGEFANKNYKEAAASFQKLESRHPGDVRVAESRLQAAWAYLNASLFDNALKSSNAALESAESSLPAAFRVEHLYIRACALFQLLRYDEAVKAYAETVAADPQGPYAAKSQYQMALAAYRNARYAEAMAALAAVLADPAMRRDGLWLMAESASGAGDADAAVQHYKLLVSEFPDSPYAPDALYRLGHQLQLRKSWTDASVFFLQLAERFPESDLAPRALFASASSLSSAGQGPQALRDWTEYLKRYPDAEGVPEALYQKALEEIRQNLKTEALGTLDALLTRFPKTSRLADAQLWRGHLLVEKGNLKDAETAFRAVLAGTPSDDARRQARFSLAMTLQQGERQDEAATIFQSLIDDPVRAKFTPQQLAWLSEHQFAKRDFANAGKTAAILVEHTQDPGWRQVAWTLAARAFRAQDQNEEAEKAYRAAIAIEVRSRHFAESTLRLAELMLERGDAPEAERLFALAVERCAAPELQPLRIHAYAGLGRAAIKAGRKDDAAKYLMMVSLLYKDDALVPPIMAETIRILDELGRAADADSIRDDLVATYPESKEAAEVKRSTPEAAK